MPISTMLKAARARPVSCARTRTWERISPAVRLAKQAHLSRSEQNPQFIAHPTLGGNAERLGWRVRDVDRLDVRPSRSRSRNLVVPSDDVCRIR